MSTRTSGNLNLVKPSYSDTVDIAVINTNMDTIDSAVTGIQSWKPSGNGEAGQILRSNGNGTSSWADAATQSEVGSAVTTWLGQHVAQETGYVIDNTLSVAGAAADAKKAGALKKAIDELYDCVIMTKDTEGGVGVVYPYEIISGKTYFVKNASNTSINVRTSTSDGTTIEEVKSGMTAYETYIFTATQNASYIRLYSSGKSIAIVGRYGYVINKLMEELQQDIEDAVDDVETDVLRAEDNISKLKSVIDELYDCVIMTKDTEGGVGVVYPYEIISGKTYFVKNASNTSINVRTSTSDGTTIEEVKSGMTAYETYIFTATQNASYIRLYSSGKSTAIIGKYGYVINKFVGDIQQYLEETRETLQEEASQYQNGLGYCYKKRFFTEDMFIKGNIDYTDGSIFSSEYTIVTSNFVSFKDIPNYAYIVVPDGYTLVAYAYTAADHEHYYGYYTVTGSRLFNINYFYKFTFTKESVKLNPDDIKKLDFMVWTSNSKTLYPEMFGAVPNDSTVDNTNAFYNLFQYIKNNTHILDVGAGRSFYDAGEYDIVFSGKYNLQTIELSDFINLKINNLYACNEINSATVLSIGMVRNCVFTNCTIDGGLTSNCVAFTDGYANVIFESCTICRFGYFGITCSGSGTGHELKLSNCQIFQIGYTGFEELKNERDYGCCLRTTGRYTDNQFVNNVFCYSCGNLIDISTSANFFTNNHFYNNDHNKIRIFDAANLFMNNYFDSILVSDERGGNLFSNNLFLTLDGGEVLALDDTYYYSRTTLVKDNIVQTDAAQWYTVNEGFNDEHADIKDNYRLP